MNIKVSKVRVSLPGGRILFRIEKLEIPLGSKILIHGPSGQGKTTLLHLLSGLLVSNEGSVYFNDQRLNTLDDEERSRIRRRHFGIVFQKLNLLDHLTAFENVSLALPPSRDKKTAETVIGALYSVNMEKFAKQRSATMSLGEQQRVAVARVLAARPDVILADEPTSSLDETNAKAIMKALFKASEGKTFVVVSHDLRIRGDFETLIDFSEYVSQ